MNAYVTKITDERFNESYGQADGSVLSNQSIIDLGLTSYISENTTRKAYTLDATFKQLVNELSQVVSLLRSRYYKQHSVLYLLYPGAES